MKGVRVVLCATDFSKASNPAFTTAINMAAASGATLTLVTVLTPLIPLVPEQTLETSSWRRIQEETKAWAGEQLARLAAKAEKAGITTTTVVRTGEAAKEIVRAAKAARADMVVIGTHGRTGFSKLLLGSVAQRVVATSSCPVLTVRGA